ncbi:MAG: hypothetical protein Q4A78_12355 [Peptostreptococcaceae bacterium]|nr:hypothetical protein [Peptostreptococcaceae bacterium]
MYKYLDKTNLKNELKAALAAFGFTEQGSLMVKDGIEYEFREGSSWNIRMAGELICSSSSYFAHLFTDEKYLILSVDKTSYPVSFILIFHEEKLFWFDQNGRAKNKKDDKTISVDPYVFKDTHITASESGVEIVAFESWMRYPFDTEVAPFFRTPISKNLRCIFGIAKLLGSMGGFFMFEEEIWFFLADSSKTLCVKKV